MPIKKMFIGAVTGAVKDGTWTTESLSAPNFLKGFNADSFLPPTTPPSTYRSDQLLGLIREHETVVFQHWPEPGWINDVLQSGRIQRVLLWADYSAVPSAGYWSPYQKSLEVLMHRMGYRVDGTKKNRFGHMMVDPYELTAGTWEMKPHCWRMRVWDRGYQEAYMQVIADSLKPYRGLIAGLLVDEAGSLYWGTATNHPETTPEIETGYKAGFDYLFSGLAGLGLERWANCPAQNMDHSALLGKWGELDLVSTLNVQKIADEIITAVKDGQNYVIGPENLNNGYTWGLTDRVSNLIQLIPPAYHERLSVLTARTSKFLFKPTVC